MIDEVIFPLTGSDYDSVSFLGSQNMASYSMVTLAKKVKVLVPKGSQADNTKYTCSVGLAAAVPNNSGSLTSDLADRGRPK